MLLEQILHETTRLGYKSINPQKYATILERRRGSNPITSYKYFDDTKSIFVHIPKTAGVSICNSLYGIDIIGHAKLKHYQIAFDYQSFSRYFKFCFVRNPWDRLYSAYNFLKAGGWHERDKKWATDNLEQFKDFEDFVINGLGKKSIMSEIHMIPQHIFIRNTFNNFGVDFIGRFENINNDISIVASKLGIEVDLSHKNKSDNLELYRDAYSSQMKDRVSHVYNTDISAFSYVF